MSNPPPLPPTPPSKGRILSLNKCYRKAKLSLSKGIRQLTKSEDPEEEEKVERNGNKIAESGSESSFTSDPTSPSNHTPSCQESEIEGYETISFPPSQSEADSYTAESTVIPEEDCNYNYDEDDDSSKWTISVPSSSESHGNLENDKDKDKNDNGNVKEEEIQQNHNPSDSTAVPLPEPILSKNEHFSVSFKPDIPTTTKSPPVPSLPPDFEPDSVSDPRIPSFPSSASSDESFKSCASTPEKLASLTVKEKPLSLNSPFWSALNTLQLQSPGTRSRKPIANGVDLDATEELEMESDMELDQDQELELDLVQAVTSSLVYLEERPETGPGEEHSHSHSQAKPQLPQDQESQDEDQHLYQNVDLVSQSPNMPDGSVHAVINLPPKMLQVVKERRRRSSVEDGTHGRSTRLSKLMRSTDLRFLEPSDESKKVKKPGRMRRLIGMSSRHYMNKSMDSSSLSEDPVFEENPEGEVGAEPIFNENKSGSEFEDLRRLVKSGGDFCKDLASVLHERSELESQYAKGLAKLSAKLLKASKESKGSVANSWQAIAAQIDTQAELHKQWAASLEEEIAKPLRTSTDTQHKIRKSVEGLVDKTTRNLADWRLAEAKAKRHCFSCSKEFEKMVGGSDISPTQPSTNNRNSSITELRPRSRLLSAPPGDKDPIKLESKRRKAEEAARRADVDYYTFCVRSERARLEWEGAIRNGSTCLRTLEEEKLSLLKDMAEKYVQLLSEFGPRWMGSVESLLEPLKISSVQADMTAIADIRRHVGAEQLLPDFYAEDTSNLMNRQRRREALQKCFYLITQDVEREKKSAGGLESLVKAINQEVPSPDTSHSNHDVADKLYYLRSMLLYLQASRCKVDNALCDVEGRARASHPISQYMRYQRDKQGLPQTVLKVPSWAREECLAWISDPVPDWNDRGKADGTPAHPENDDFNETETEKEREISEEKLRPVGIETQRSTTAPTSIGEGPSIGRCRAIYDYEANLFDELTIRVGDEINIHDKQEDGWWLGELRDKIGIFPATYVEEI